MPTSPSAGSRRPQAAFSRIEALCVLILLLLVAAIVLRAGRQRAPRSSPEASSPSPPPAAEGAGEWRDESEAAPAAARHFSAEPLSAYDELPTNSVTVPAPAGPARTDAAPARAAAEAVAPQADSSAAAVRLTPDLRRRLGPSIVEQLERIAAMEWGPEAEAMLVRLIASVGQSDPLAALDLAAACGSRRARDQAVNAVLKQWSRSDPAAALEWFLQAARVNPSLVSSAAPVLFEQLAARNMDLAITRVWALPTSSMKRSALAALVTRLVGDGNESVLFDLRASLAPGRDRDLLDSAMIRAMTRFNAEDMADWALGLPDAAERRRAVGEVISEWGYDQPAAAAEWVEALPHGAERERGLSRLAAVWASQDPVAAANWLLSLGVPSPELDRAIGVFARIVARRDPAGARAWAQNITDPAERERVTRQISGPARGGTRAP